MINDSVLNNLIGNDGKGLEFKNDLYNNIVKHIENPRDAFIKRALNYSFWNLIIYILKQKVSDTSGTNLMNFNTEEFLAINLGYVSELIAKQSSKFSLDNVNEIFKQTLCINNVDIKFYCVTEWLNEQLKEFMGVYEIEKLKAENETKTLKIQEYKKSNEEIFQNKKKVLAQIAKALNNQQLFLKVYNLSEKINQISNKYALYKFKSNSGLPLSKEERLEFVNIENEITVSKNERKEIIKSYLNLNNEICKYEDDIITNEIELLQLVSELAKSKNELENFINLKNNISVAKKEEFISERTSYLKSMAELVSKRNKIEPMPCLSEKVPSNLPDIIINELCEYLKADPYVFKNKKFKRFGYPSIIFIPGYGNGLYSYDYNALIIPLFPLTTYKESIITAMVLYRWDCDEEKEFRDSFNSLKPYKKLSFVDLQRSLIKDFVTYITKELKGYKIFDKEIRDWFNWQVAPKKDDVIEFEVVKIGENIQEPSKKQFVIKSETQAETLTSKLNTLKEQLNIIEKELIDLENALNIAHENAMNATKEATRLSEEAARLSIEAARADILVKTEYMIKAAEMSKEASNATIKAAEAAKLENEAKINYENKKNEYEKLKNEYEKLKHEVENEQQQLNAKKQAEQNKIAEIKKELETTLKNLEIEKTKVENELKQIENELQKLKSDLQDLSLKYQKEKINIKTIENLKDLILNYLKLPENNLLTIENIDSLRQQALIKAENEILNDSSININIKDESVETNTNFNEVEELRTLFEEQLNALKSELEILKKENEKLKSENEKLLTSNNQTIETKTEIKVSDKFITTREFIYSKIKNILKLEQLGDKIIIEPSNKNNKSINIHLNNVNIESGELDLILNTLSIQAKLQKFIEMIKD